MKGKHIIVPEVLKQQASDQLHVNPIGIEKQNYWCVSQYTRLILTVTEKIM